MKTFLCALFASVMAVGAGELQVQSFDANGRIAFNQLSNATRYRIEWSPTAGGAWTTFTGAATSGLDQISPASGDTVAVSVPMLYRVIATVTTITMYAFNFEGGAPLQEDGGAFSLSQENEENPEDLSIVADPYDAANHVRKFMLHATDTVHSTYQRVEDKIYQGNWHAEMGREYWYGFRTLIRSNEWPLGAGSLGGDRWLVIAQWHDIPDHLYHLDGIQREEWKPPTLALYVINGKYKILYLTDPEPISVPTNGTQLEWEAFDRRSLGCPTNQDWAYDWQGQTDTTPEGQEYRWWQGDMLADRNSNRWVKWVFHVKWTWDNTGFLEIWKDGVKIIDKHDYSTSFNDYAGPTVKFGLYRSAPYSRTPYNGMYFDRALYVDEYRVGDARGCYEAVVPRGGN